MPTGAHSYAEMLPYFEEACTYLATQEPAAVLLQGHWNTQGLGCPSEMNVPEVTSAPSTMLSLRGIVVQCSVVQYTVLCSLLLILMRSNVFVF